MPMTKAQIDIALELLERFVEAHETLAEAAVTSDTPTVSGAQIEVSVPAQAQATVDDEPARGDTDNSSADPFGLPTTSQPAPEPTPAASDVPDESDIDNMEEGTQLDLKDKDAVKAFRAAVGNLIREYGAATSPEVALDLIEEVTPANRKFSAVPDDMLTTLHDSVYDALNENG